MKRWIALVTSIGILFPGTLGAYPLDGYKDTDITRLDAYWLARQVIIDQKILPKGIFWKSDDIKLRLLGDSSYTLPAPDPALSAKIKAMLGSDWRSYGIALLDYTDPKNPVYAAVNPNRSQNPASVGKIAIMLAVMLVCIVLWGFLAMADRVQALLGTTGMNVVTRIMGLIMLAVAMEFLTGGLSEKFPAWVQDGSEVEASTEDPRPE